MILSTRAQELYDDLCGLTVIDAHEHLPAEADYLACRYSGANLFAGGYIWLDLASAGMPLAVQQTLRDPGPRPVEGWWPALKPFWELVKHGSYARALRITAHDLYEISQIDDTTIEQLAAAVQADNYPGLYARVLHERCRIEQVISYTDRPAYPDDAGMCGITALLKTQFTGSASITDIASKAAREVTSLEDLVYACQALLRQDLAAGAVGFKMLVWPYPPPNAELARREFVEAMRSHGQPGRFLALERYLIERCFDVAADADVPVAVHAGYWGDFRQLDPKLLFDYALSRPEVRFDLFHLGSPMLRDAALIGKVLSNVTLNLCWCPVISQVQTKRMLDEILDLVPLNKVIAFGGDYRVAVQKVYGHLVMAREVVAAALADRIDSGALTYREALDIATLWFYENPKRIYRLPARQQAFLPPVDA